MPLNAQLREELVDLVPHGLVVTRSWLTEQDISPHAIDNLVKSGQLLSLTSGVYTRPGTVPTWQGLVCALQRMGSDLHVGGESALVLHGLNHYIALSEHRTIHLFGHDTMPSWMNRLLPDVTFERHSHHAFRNPLSSSAQDPETRKDPLAEYGFTVAMPWSDVAPPLMVSTPELAFLEVLGDVPERFSFEHADELMQGLATLSPRRLERLLSFCRSVKIRRLFFWFAERHVHPWLSKLNPANYDLGSGKRLLAKGGKLDRKYRITVPEHMHG